MRYSLKISSKYREFSIFHRYFDDFFDFLANQLLVSNIIVGPLITETEKIKILFVVTNHTF